MLALSLQQEEWGLKEQAAGAQQSDDTFDQHPKGEEAKQKKATTSRPPHRSDVPAQPVEGNEREEDRDIQVGADEKAPLADTQSDDGSVQACSQREHCSLQAATDDASQHASGDASLDRDKDSQEEGEKTFAGEEAKHSTAGSPNEKGPVVREDSKHSTGGSPHKKAPVVIVLDDSDDENEVPTSTGDVFANDDHMLALSLQQEEWGLKGQAVGSQQQQHQKVKQERSGAPDGLGGLDDPTGTQEQEKLQHDSDPMQEDEEEPLEVDAQAEEDEQQKLPMQQEEMEEEEPVARQQDMMEEVPVARQQDMMEEDEEKEDGPGPGDGDAAMAGEEMGEEIAKVQRQKGNLDPENEEELAEQVFQQLNEQRDLKELELDAAKRLDKGWFEVELKRHQIQGLGWMLSVEDRRKDPETSKFPSGGILADTMGLGKTLEMLALIATTASEESKDRIPYFQRKRDGKKHVCLCKDEIEDDETAVQCSQCSRWFHACEEDCDRCEPAQRFDDLDELIACKRFHYLCKVCSSKASGSDSLDAPCSTLVVVPTGVATQWRDEVEAKAPNMRVLLYYGSQAKKKFANDPALLTQFDIVITTYGSLNNECPTESNKWSAGALFRTRWRRVVLDEAHQIRNKGTKACIACKTLEATTYWCMTGTPVVNRLTDFEAYALFICNQIEAWQWLPTKLRQVFNVRFSDLKEDAHLAKNVQQLLMPILLRRTKGDKIDGKKILVLPEKVITVKADLALSDRESVLYGRLESGFKLEFNKLVKKGYKQNMMNILALLMRLRQFCNHPGLLPAKMLKSLVQQDNEQDGGEIEGGSSDSDSDAAKVEGGAGKDEEKDGEKHDVKKEKWSGMMARRASAVVGDVLSQSQSQADADEQGGEDGEGGNDGKELDLNNLEDVEAKMIENEDAQKDDALPLFLSASTKAIAVAEEIQSMLKEDPNNKILVFCMFPRFFSMLKDTDAFKDDKIPHLTIEGSDSLETRGHRVAQFKRDPRIRVFLMSTKCCCHGLNLTIACRGIIVDPWWNSGSEEQAVDRMHRMGQLNIVQVTKFIVASTVEERMYIIQQEKAEMAALALGEGTGMMTRRKQNLSLRELKKLFGVGAHPPAAAPVPPVPQGQDPVALALAAVGAMAAQLAGAQLPGAGGR